MMSLIEGMNPETPYEATLTSELSALRKARRCCAERGVAKFTSQGFKGLRGFLLEDGEGKLCGPKPAHV